MISRKDILAVSALAFVVLVTAHGWFNGNLPLTDDLQHAHITDIGHITEAFLEHGRLTRWDHHNVTPFGIFHPLPIATLAAFPLSLALGPIWGTKLTLIAFLILGGIGMFQFARLWNLGPTAAFTTGIFYSLFRWNIIENVSAGHMDMTAVLALFPWTAVALETALRTASLRRAGWAGLGLACMASADFQFTVIGTLLLGIYLALRLGKPLWLKTSSEGSGVRVLGAATASALIGSSYIAATIWTNKPYFNFSGHGRYWLDIFSVSFGELLMCWSSVWTGRPDIGLSPNVLHAWPWVVAILGFLWKAPRGALIIGGSWTLVSSLLAMGTRGPFEWLFHNAPLFDHFRAPLRFYWGASAGLSLLIGACLEGVSQRWKNPVPILSAGALCLLILGAGNGPWVGSLFRTQIVPPRIELLKKAVKIEPKTQGLLYYPLIPAGMDREERLATLYHHQRDWSGPAQFQATTGIIQFLWTANYALTPHEISGFLGMIGTDLVFPRARIDASWLLQTNAFEPLQESFPIQPALRLRSTLPRFQIKNNLLATLGPRSSFSLTALSGRSRWTKESVLGVSFENEVQSQKYNPLWVWHDPGKKFLPMLQNPNSKFLEPQKIQWSGIIRPVLGPSPDSRGVLDFSSLTGTLLKHPGQGLDVIHLLLPNPLDFTQEFLELYIRGSAHMLVQFDFLFGDARTIRSSEGSLGSLPLPLRIDLSKNHGPLRALRMKARSQNGKKGQVHLVRAVVTSRESRTKKSWAFGNIEDLFLSSGTLRELSIPQIEILESKPLLGFYKLRILNKTPGQWLMVSEPWYPGWKASSGQKSIPIYPAWNFLLGIPLDSMEGETLTIRYGLTQLETAGLGISLFLVFGLFLATIRSRWIKTAR